MRESVEAKYGHNQANVIFERFGDEVVAIHLGTGCYYSLPAAAGDAFVLLSSASTIPEIAGALSNKYDAPAPAIADDLRTFVRQLRDEGLVAEVKHAYSAEGALNGMFADPRLPYVAPSVSSHRDLENLFLIDPVHDASEEGWPHVKKAPERGQPVCYRFASERCLIERFDEASIALNLSTGAYFSFSGPAEDILLLLHHAPMPAEIVQALAKKYEAPEEQLSDAVERFLNRLFELELLLAEEVEGGLIPRDLPLVKPGEGLKFEEPEIDVFRDTPAAAPEARESEPEPSLLSGQKKFRLNREENFFAFAEDGAVAVNMVRGNYYILNETAARVLRMLERETLPQDVVAAINGRYIVRRPELVAASIVLLRNFVGIGLASTGPAGQFAMPAAGLPAAIPQAETARVPFETFSVDMRQDLREQICLYPGSRPVAPEPAARARQLSSVLEDYFVEAASRAPVFDTKLTIAGRSVLIRCIGDTHSRNLSLALSHLRSDFNGDPEFTIHVWDGDAGGISTNSLLSSYLHNLYRDWTSCCGSRGELRGFHSAGFPAFYMPGSDVLNLVDLENKKAYFLKRDASPLPYWEAGSPFRSILHAWLSASGLQYVHGGAVGDGDGGVLLAGRGGSGKSTTTLLCLNAGMRYAGDDYCAVAGGWQASRESAPFQLHSLYNTAKLLPRDLDRFPELRARIWNPRALVEDSPDKAVFFLNGVMPERMSHGFPLRAILIPRVEPGIDTYLTPCGPGAALAALAPSTIAQLQTTAQIDMDRLAALASSLPAYTLHLGSDLTQVADAVRSALHRQSQAAP